MTISDISTQGSWRDVANNARITIGMEDKDGGVSDKWKNKILKAEHSPIRQRLYIWTWYDIPYWVSVHIVRHKIGIEHFVKTSRSDKTGVERSKLPQDLPVNHRCVANAQALISISRKRLCYTSSKETRDAWLMLKEEIKKVDSIMAANMVKECVYRGFCSEFNTCGFILTNNFNKDRIEYVKGVN